MTASSSTHRLDKLHIHSVRSGQAQCEPGRHLRPRTLDKYVLCAVTGGRLALRVNGIDYSVAERELCMLLPGMLAEAQAAGDDPASFTLIAFSADLIVKRHNGRLAESPPNSLFRQTESLAMTRMNEQAVKQLHLLRTLHREGSRLELKYRLHLFLKELLSRQAEWQEPSSVGMEVAVEHMERHYTREWDVASLSALAGLSVNHFIRTFKKRMNMTPMEYIQKLRMTKAKELLFSTLRIKDIANQLGYHDEHYFSRVFKKAEGVAPTMFMRTRNHRIAAMYYGLDDYLLTLGIAPVAALSYAERVSRYYNVPPLKHAMEELVSSSMNYDLLRKAQPDLILSSDRLGRNNELERVAPTAIIPYSNDHEHLLSEIGDILGRREQAHSWTEQYNERRFGLQDKLGSQLGRQTVYFIRISDLFIRVYGAANQTGALLYHDLGLVLPDAFPRQQWAIEIGMEDFSRYNAAHLFIAVDPTVRARQRWRSLVRSEHWMSLEAVREQRVYDASDLLFKTLGPTGRVWAMDYVASQLMRTAR
ncbi:AraC family transcriptional regulator [Paenibacillus sp. SYP-B4298]|uniref:AraC family transcriptional regulator n=1 Tax=Paenibacillus sp. SYP-B4298 TaxID=2996034 RepID=UPI0022DDBB6B|nr:AraC family transcriptional regulator [Paenibacillus sp. SYP-B4298]